MNTTEPVDSGRSPLGRAVLSLRNVRGVLRRTRHLRRLAVVTAALSLAPAGCGSGVSEALRQTGAAAQRNFLDLLLTELAAALADAPGDTTESIADTEPVADGEDEVDTPNEPPGEVTDTGGLEDLAGDGSRGEALFAVNGCAACHCEDATGGCALEAPSLLEVDVAAVDENLRGEGPHPIAVELSDQEIVDLQAYLVSLGP